MIKKLLLLDEGLKLSPYKDTQGLLTIGVGHNLDAKPISHEAAIRILDDDLAEVGEQLTQSLPWYQNLSVVRRAVFEDMAFNLGIAGLLKFKGFLAAMHDGKWDIAVKEMFDSHWAYQVGDGPGLKRDRVDRLAGMVRSNKWPKEL